jgi:hypothetical protein
MSISMSRIAIQSYSRYVAPATGFSATVNDDWVPAYFMALDGRT